LSKYRDNPNLQQREYKPEPTRKNDAYPRWLEKLIQSDFALSHLAKKKSTKRRGR